MPLSASQPHRGDLSGFNAVYRSELDPMRRVAFLIVGSVEHAEDIAQDAFLELYQRWASVNEPGAYVRRAVINRSLSAQRRRAHERKYLSTLRRTHFVDQDDPTWKSIDALPVRQRAALVCTYYLQLTSAEAAAALNCRPATVRSLLSRALSTLRKELT